MQKTLTQHPFFAATMALSLGLVACGERGGATSAPSAVVVAASAASGNVATAPAAAASSPPVGVTTVKAQQRDVPVLVTATGSVAPLASVDVRPQVTSLITLVHVKEGQFVRAGELLFSLDARPDESNVARATSQLAKDQAALADAQRQLARSRDLLAQQFISQGAVDTNQTAVDAQQAAVSASRAALNTAKLALSYTRISAPSAGRLGSITVYPGSSVQANVTPLVSITQLNPIAVAFSLPQRNLADALTALKNGGAAVTATAPEGGATATGRLQFVDNAVDATSGTVKVKAVFDNKDNKLWPGAFVNVAMTLRTLAGAVVLPQAAIIQAARGPLVYVVQDGKAQPRPVQLLFAQGEDAAVSGVKAGERIVLDGRQNLRPGAAVIERPRDAVPKSAAAPGVASAASAASAGGKTAPSP
jgi:RND family efflux transporter MFP subunit